MEGRINSPSHPSLDEALNSPPFQYPLCTHMQEATGVHVDFYKAGEM